MPATISIIIPFFNEEENIPVLLKKIVAFEASLKPATLEIIFVDDGSSDNSVKNIIESTAQPNSFKIIKLSKNSGSHAAIRAGILHSDSRYITIFSADMQDPLSLINELYLKCISGSDIVFGQRRSVKEKFLVSLFSRIYAKLMRKFVAANYPTQGVDVVMFNEKVADVLNANIEANSNFVLQLLSFGFKQSFVEYDKTERKSGVSKWTFAKKVKLFIDSFVAFSYVPIRFVTVMGITFFFVGVIWTGYVITREIIYGDVSQGWPTLISVLLIGFGLTNISLGIIAEYLWRTLDSSRKRPVFIIDEIIDFNKDE